MGGGRDGASPTVPIGPGIGGINPDDFVDLFDHFFTHRPVAPERHYFTASIASAIARPGEPLTARDPYTITSEPELIPIRGRPHIFTRQFVGTPVNTFGPAPSSSRRVRSIRSIGLLRFEATPQRARVIERDMEESLVNITIRSNREMIWDVPSWPAMGRQLFALEPSSSNSFRVAAPWINGEMTLMRGSFPDAPSGSLPYG